jgi:hypothetical protein
VGAEWIEVRGERAVLSPETPDRWVAGTQLRGLLTSLVPGTGLPARGAIDPDRVVVRHQGRPLVPGSDYVLDREWGSLGLGPAPSFPVGDEVEIDYRYSLLRIDAVVADAVGAIRVVRGESRLSAPLPPAVDTAAGEHRVANLFVGYGEEGEGERFDLLASSADAPTRTTSGRITRRGRIVFWGDSVTTGAEASSPSRSFPALVASALGVDVEVIAAGGSNSGQWLGVTPLPDVFDPAEVCFERVAEAQPDVIVAEFVNDAGFDMDTLAEVHKEWARRLGETGADVIVVAPHLTGAVLMGTDDLRTAEIRPQVLALYDLADREGWALADASSRWAHLWREGIPHTTLLVNGINHPDDRGHQLLADEVIRCFA